MKKKISVVYSVDYKTEIEIDTELEEGCYDLDELNNWDNLEEINKLLENKLSDIDIPETKESVYRTGSFIIKSIQI